ncbi:MAG: serine hydrolase domain-containing protein [Acidimicrobiales bacterium]
MAVLPPSNPPSVPLPPQPEGVPWPTTGWPTADPDPAVAQRLDELLDEAFSPGAADDANGVAATALDTEPFGSSLAFVAIHRGQLVAERYGPTAGPDEKLISWSMAKSFTHALIGVLAGESRLDIDAPAAIPAWSDPSDTRSAITIDHLLRMVPGTLFNEDYVDDKTSHCIQMLFGDGKPDMAAYTAALDSITEPNTQFNYSSGTTVLLCRILADIVGSGQAFEAWMNQTLLQPLGIDADLTFDEVGTWVGSSFLHASARDFAKFGLLYLRDGMWEGERLLPPGWVDYARTMRAVDEEGGRYSAHWWINSGDEAVFYASGYETQRIIVDPAADLILVRLGKTSTALGQNVDAWLDRIRDLFRS